MVKYSLAPRPLMCSPEVPCGSFMLENCLTKVIVIYNIFWEECASGPSMVNILAGVGLPIHGHSCTQSTPYVGD